jgi:hypothetical protein
VDLNKSLSKIKLEQVKGIQEEAQGNNLVAKIKA